MALTQKEETLIKLSKDCGADGLQAFYITAILEEEWQQDEMISYLKSGTYKPTEMLAKAEEIADRYSAP